MRTYERTHPWINFSLDLRKVGARSWILLGEAVSKAEHIANTPLRPTTAESLHKLYLAKGVLATTAIEGNTLTEEEVLKRLDGELNLPPSREYLGKEIDNVVSTCGLVLERINQNDAGLTPEILCEYNRRILDGLALEKDTIPGELRRHSVVVGNVYRGAPAKDCEFLLRELCLWLAKFPAEPGMEKAYGILKAIIAHVYLAWIHPFGVGNGRTARLGEFHILLSSGIPTPAAHLLSNHYNLTRSEYYRQLDRASKSGGDLIPFIEYSLRGFVDGLREQLSVIRAQQWDVAWRNYIHESFRNTRTTRPYRRRRDLALDLSGKGEVPINQLTQLTPRLAIYYATRTRKTHQRDHPERTPKTLQRDLLELQKLDLIERIGNSVRAKQETILAFLPWTKKE